MLDVLRSIKRTLSLQDVGKEGNPTVVENRSCQTGPDDEDSESPVCFSPITEQDNEDIEEANNTDFEKDSTDHKLDNEIENLSQFLQPNTVPLPEEIDQDAETSALNDKGGWLRWHYRLGHLLYSNIKLLMLLATLSRKLLKIQPPLCAFYKNIPRQGNHGG